ncbi:RdgB/HAM1 family non-canonical purine NTP pyrophosphatase [Ampullimonas aquatilis]|uniref:RdgB/HAM1 family non-canonical purine NTP pyrophosphatase n=1 Tax=Ampullimonas aquatilis TaxID=1341549 RepID=UPI003C7725D4
MQSAAQVNLQKLVLASNNQGKLREFEHLLAPLGIAVFTQSQFNVAEAEEPHPSFVENALAKARHAAQQTGLPALADDSGLCMNALAGAPGVLSARYATLFGHDKSDANNNAALLDAMSGHTDRRGFYYCALVLVRSAEDPIPLIAEGRWHGELLMAPLGQGGFGYDPLFYLPALKVTAAQLTAEQKNLLSHRALAMQDLLKKLSA